MRTLVTGKFLRRLLLGKPLKTDQMEHQRLNNFMALAVFSSDALSSVAYGTEEILWVLVAASMVGLSLPIHAAIVTLLVILTLSYRQTIHAYPNGGGSYIVAKDNLGDRAGLVAGAALLTDYVLTVAVSVSAGIAAITSLIPVLLPYRVAICVAAIAFMTLVNLRGVRESGAIFSAPTYAFVITTIMMIITGLVKYLTGHLAAVPVETPATSSISTMAVVVIALRAFAAGCTSLTGVEAISNGIPAFRRPESANAAKTMAWMATLLGTMAIGMGFLTSILHVVPNESETIMSQLAATIFGRSSILYALHQFFTLLILVLAANTSFNDFPRLSALMAKDRYLPRSMASLGDKLVFSNGIVLLAALAIALVVAFQGATHALLPLYAIGVFVSFTMSQTGMVIHWLRLRRHQKVAWPILVNGLGAVTTAVVSVVIMSTKFIHGAWIVMLLIPSLIYLFSVIHGHYAQVRWDLKVGHHTRLNPQARDHVVVMLIGGTQRVTRNAVEYVMTLVDHSNTILKAVHVNLDQDDLEHNQEQLLEFRTWVGDEIALDIVDSPYRSLIQPLESYMQEIRDQYPDHIISLVIPEFIPQDPVAARMLHGLTGRMLYQHFRKLGYKMLIVPTAVCLD